MGHSRYVLCVFSSLLSTRISKICKPTQVSPPLFAQMYTIHAEYLGAVHPLVYALLPNKAENTYNRMFTELKRLQPNLNPTLVVTDFERAAINALATAFPNVSTAACFFHFSHSIWRKIQEFGLATLYRTDANFMLKAKMLLAVAFVPVQHIDAYYDDAADELENFPGLTAVQLQNVSSSKPLSLRSLKLKLFLDQTAPWLL